LSFKKGWTLRKLAHHLNMPKTNIVKRLKRLEAKKVDA
jgi:DNA-binding MarR family transcriptional regulator